MQLRHLVAAMALATAAMPALAQNDTKAGVDAFMKGDFAEAVRIWRPLAIAGDADAQYNLGQSYFRGRGVAEDPKQAEAWYRRAAEQGQPLARDAYGLLLFQSGRRDQALPFIEESAGRGMPQAQYVYATLLFNGDMVERDWVRAYALMTRASAGGVAQASAGLAQMDRLVPLDQRQRGLQLARAFEIAADKPDLDTVPAIRPADLPPSQPGSEPRNPAVALQTLEKPLSPRVPVAKPVAKAALRAPSRVETTATSAGQASGNWRVQLGAFGSSAGAKGLWTSLRAKIPALVPYQHFEVPAGAVTRLQAGPLPTRAAAEQLCAKVRAAGNACLPAGG